MRRYKETLSFPWNIKVMKIELNIGFTIDEKRQFLTDRGFTIKNHYYEEDDYSKGSVEVAIKEGDYLSKYMRMGEFNIDQVFEREFNKEYTQYIKDMMLSKSKLREDKLNKIL